MEQYLGVITFVPRAVKDMQRNLLSVTDVIALILNSNMKTFGPESRNLV